MTEYKRVLVGRMIIALLVVQGVCSAVLLSLDALSAVSESQFTLLLGVNLVALDMVIYVYRTAKLNDPIKSYWIAAGFALILVLLVSNFYLPS